jgi:hypothetical protein
VEQENSIGGFISEKGIRRTGNHTGCPTAQTAYVDILHPKGLYFGYPDASIECSELPLMMNYTCHLASTAAGTSIVIYQDTLHNFSRWECGLGFGCISGIVSCFSHNQSTCFMQGKLDTQREKEYSPQGTSEGYIIYLWI